MLIFDHIWPHDGMEQGPYFQKIPAHLQIDAS